MILHAALVSQHSPTLDRLMNGEMLEAKQGTADFGDIDEVTFVRFSEWLYTGQYSIVSPRGQGSENGVEDHHHTKSIPWNYGLNAKARRKKEKQMKWDGTWKGRVTEDMIEEVPQYEWAPNTAFSTKGHKKQEVWKTFTRQSAYNPSAPPRSNTTGCYPDRTDDFLGHAKLYCFADKYGILPLQELCLNSLKMCLIECECQESQVLGIVDLIAYTINNTPATSVEEAETLRSVVLDFAVIVFETLTQNKAFKELLAMDNGLAAELLLLLGRRLD